MANIVRKLDESLAYMFCPACEKQGTENSHLTREMHLIKCMYGHVFTAQQLAAMKAKMITLPESGTLVEQPNPLSVKKSIYVLPQVWARLEERYKGRFNATLSTVLDALSDARIVFISGDDADELRRRGLTNGAQIVAAVKSADQLEKERQQAIQKLEQYEAILRSVDEGEGGGGGAGERVAP